MIDRYLVDTGVSREDHATSDRDSLSLPLVGGTATGPCTMTIIGLAFVYQIRSTHSIEDDCCDCSLYIVLILTFYLNMVGTRCLS